MKIVSAKPLNDGMLERDAERLWDKIEQFASYSFNRSHAVEYSIISYWCQWVRVHYPAEYFAACMSIVDEDKLPGLVKDAREAGIEVMPPDVNLSTDRYTIPNDSTILAPFSAIKGCSENTAKKIVAMRDAAGGSFKDKADFANHAKTPKSGVNVRVVENLDKVGAFANLETGTPSPKHFSRRKDQMELMPGLIIDAVKADRTTDLGEKFLRAKVIHLIQDYKKCQDCDLKDSPHPTVRAKSTVKFMVVSDCPTWQEEKKDKLLEGDAATYVKQAITKAGLGVSEGYYTTLVKAKKSDKFLTNAQINGCSKFLDRELELIKPAVIVALGSAAIKRFVPGTKGGTSELVGKAIYDPALDATIVCGINAQQIGFDPDKQEILDAVFAQVADILS